MARRGGFRTQAPKEFTVIIAAILWLIGLLTVLGTITPPNRLGLWALVVAGGLLILAGPAYEPNMTSVAGKPGEYSIYAWDRRDGLKLLRDLPPFAEGDKPVKPEALLPLRTNADGSVDVLVLSDGATEGGTRLVTLP